jgi:hypothetical protein
MPPQQPFGQKSVGIHSLPRHRPAAFPVAVHGHSPCRRFQPVTAGCERLAKRGLVGHGGGSPVAASCCASAMLLPAATGVRSRRADPAEFRARLDIRCPDNKALRSAQ